MCNFCGPAKLVDGLHTLVGIGVFVTHHVAAPRLLGRCHRAICCAARVCCRLYAPREPVFAGGRALASVCSAMVANEHCEPSCCYTTIGHGHQPGRVRAATATEPGPMGCGKASHAQRLAILEAWVAPQLQQ